jgi:hypothetical protein
MNFQVLKKTRKPPRVGDVFVLRPAGADYLWGRVVSVDANPLGVGGAVLLYIYRVRTVSKDAPDVLGVDQLLVPPIMTNAQPFTKGYFEVVENRPITTRDRLAQHCFVDSRGWYWDEAGKRLPGPCEPMGRRVLHSFRTIDDAVSEALGIPLSLE